MYYMKSLLLKSCLFLVCCIMITSCVKNVYITDEEDKKEDIPEEEEKPTTIALADLKIKRFTILPENNSGIYAQIDFEEDDSKVWTGIIYHYEADIAALKATFEVVASRVTVNDVEQISNETVNDFSKKQVYRLYATDGQYKDFEVKLEQGTRTGFPLVAISTDGNKPIVSRDKWLSGHITIDMQQDERYESYSGKIEIKGRGNNSWGLDKKPYAIKLLEKKAVMGMKKHKRWVLLANASDKTLLRNRTAFEIARRTGLAWTPDSRFVEVILNGKYLGSYLLCEQIRVDENRVNIAEMKSEDNEGESITGGYILECDRYYDEINKFRSAYRDLPINIKDPDEEVLTVKQKQYITDYVNGVEKLLYGGESIDPNYANFFDIKSFVDFWIVMELTHNNDTRLPGSCYMYKDRGGKLMAGPVWDFDLSTFIESRSFLLYNYEVTDFSKSGRSLWFKRLFEDPAFRACAKERWQSYKEQFEGIPQFIDEEATYLEPSADVNWSMWKVNPGAGANKDLNLSWKEAVLKLRINYVNRLQWMDGEIQKW